MTSHTIIGLLLLFVLIDAIPLDHEIRQYETRQRRSVDLNSWQAAETLFKQLYPEENRRREENEKNKRLQNPSAVKPVQGPMAIENIHMMMESRNVKRYPYSLDADPATIGR